MALEPPQSHETKPLTQQDLEKGWERFFIWYSWNSIEKSNWKYTYSSWIYKKLHVTAMFPISQARELAQTEIRTWRSTSAPPGNCRTVAKSKSRIKESDWSSSTNYVMIWVIETLKKCPKLHQTQLDSDSTLFWRMISGLQIDANWCYRIWFLSCSRCTWLDFRSQQHDGKSSACETSKYTHVDILTLRKYVCMFSPTSKPKQVPGLLFWLSHRCNNEQSGTCHNLSSLPPSAAATSKCPPG